MIIGHYGVGLGLKKFAPNISLSLLFLAVQLPDILWSILLLSGLEHLHITPEQPGFAFTDSIFSHGLLSSFVIAVLFSVVVYLVRRNTRESLIIFLAVLSHWLLDFILHKHDLPITTDPQSTTGWGLYQYPFINGLIEWLLFLIGGYFYETNTGYQTSKGKYFLPLLLLLLIVYQCFFVLGFHPASTYQVALFYILQTAFIVLAYFTDKHRYFKFSK